MSELGIVTLGHVHAEDLEPLTRRFSRLEQLVLDIHPRGALNDHRAELNRAVDASTCDWILVMRERETIGDELAQELAELTVDPPKAWGFRIRTMPLYGGSPLALGDEAGELRLFHRRHLLRRGDIGVQGTVIRAKHSFRAITFATPEEHREYLANGGAKRGAVARALVFARYAMSARTLDANTLRYLWIEAGFART